MTTTSKSAKPTKKLWPPIHEVRYTSGGTPWQVRYQINKKRKSQILHTKREAEIVAAKVRLRIANEGSAGFSLPADVRAGAVKAIEALTPYDGKTIARAVDFYIAHYLRFRNAPVSAEVIKGFLSERAKLNQRESNLAEVRQRLNKSARTFGYRISAAITAGRL